MYRLKNPATSTVYNFSTVSTESARPYMEMASDVWTSAEPDGLFSRLDCARIDLAQRIQDHLNREIDGADWFPAVPTMFAEILTDAVDTVDCDALAAYWLEQLDRDE